MRNKVSNNLYYLCSLVEFIGRKTKNERFLVVNILGKDILSHIFKYADVFHCEQIEEVADRFIQEYDIPYGTYDNVATCKYTVPDYWSIGAVYQRLIENVTTDTLIDTLIEVYRSWICKYIDNYNIAVYYMPPAYLKECYISGEILDE